MLQVGFDVLILGEEIQLTLGSYWLSPWVAPREMWNFIQVICLGQYFGYIVASEEPLLKLLLCLSKENFQLACWEWKGELFSVLTIVMVVTVRFATPWGCVVETNITWIWCFLSLFLPHNYLYLYVLNV